ncbi:MAG TPA: GntR family transcriptional regulator [Candidatus Limnocylindrales bacterium]|jgi:GntR family transcriptional regulator|nr:GntR family transcriptional regulator [Candidatus Limnocylindrales bacterium]
MSPAAVSGLPLYRQIEAELRDRIRSGALRPGARIAPEPELMSEFGVSRATVRQGLAGLVAEGVLEIRRGLGTYVTAPRFEHTIGGFYSFSREIERHGLLPGTRVLELRTEPAAEPVAEALGVPTGTDVVALRRLRLAGPDPLVVETSHLPAARFPGLESIDFSHVRLYDTLMNAYGCRPTRARETFEPVLLTADEAALLDQRRGEPALRVERIAFDQDDVPIEFCRSTVRGDRYRYSVELRDR